MQPIARSFQLALSITHPEIDPAEITRTLGLKPTGRTHRAGTPRTTPDGTPREGVWPDSYWSRRFDVRGAPELGLELEKLVGRLEEHRPFFRRLVEEGGELEFFCGVFADGNWDEEISWRLLRSLGAMRIRLRLDVYPRSVEGASAAGKTANASPDSPLPGGGSRGG